MAMRSLLSPEAHERRTLQGVWVWGLGLSMKDRKITLEEGDGEKAIGTQRVKQGTLHQEGREVRECYTE